MKKTEKMGKNVATAVVLDIYKEITEGILIDRLAKLYQAERDGRCVVLPCKVGSLVLYITSQNEIVEDKINCFYVEDGIEGLRCECLRCTFPASEIGKTVFLASEEAENALKGEGHE